MFSNIDMSIFFAKTDNIIDISIVIQQIIIEFIYLTTQFKLNLKLFHIVLIYFR